MDYYCRICWNTRNWRMPSGEAKHLEMGDSYVLEHGFGHEEWLFNFDWLLSGYDSKDLHSYRYGFLQPISKYRGSYVGETFSILLYTVDSSYTRRAVGVIKDAYVPDLSELKWALERTDQNGWLNQMRQDLNEIGISDEPLRNLVPANLANIRFRPNNVTLCNPMIPLMPPHKVTRINRYQPLYWDDGFDIETGHAHRFARPKIERDSDARDGSHAPRVRAAQPATEYEPHHTILQDQLREFLRAKYGMKAIRKEKESVDLRLVQPGSTIFIEVKLERTVKNCIRLALGQLLEYAHYPNLTKADNLLVVGDATPTEEDVMYLQFIRDTYHLPVHYARWSWQGKELLPEI